MDGGVNIGKILTHHLGHGRVEVGSNRRDNADEEVSLVGCLLVEDKVAELLRVVEDDTRLTDDLFAQRCGFDGMFRTIEDHHIDLLLQLGYRGAERGLGHATGSRRIHKVTMRIDGYNIFQLLESHP